MIAYLPEIYPDELVYSWLCRYAVHSGYITNKQVLRDLVLCQDLVQVKMRFSPF